ncbi:MAG: urea ABC transporter permease subunit UrtB [Pikeienuella sp.]|uniref:urea ABC transporter permease subunit UrtB n=1 Tax=Pikeienuella sp. TaxID=2831957 RepID=UPI00391BB44C
MRILLSLLAFCAGLWLAPAPAAAQEGGVQAILQQHRDAVASGSRRLVEPAIDALKASGLDQAREVLEVWQARELYQRTADGLFFFAAPEGEGFRLRDVDTGADAGFAAKADMTQLRPSGGVRGLIGAALVAFRLLDPDPEDRRTALAALSRSPEAGHLEPLRDAVAAETDPALRRDMERLERALTIRFDRDEGSRIEAIRFFEGDAGLDARAALAPVVATTRGAAEAAPEGANIARMLEPGDDLTEEEAWALLVEAGLAAARVTKADIRAALEANIEGAAAGGVPVRDLGSDAARERAYAALAAAGRAQPTVTDAEARAIIDAHVFFERYAEPSPAVTGAAEAALASISFRVGAMQAADLTLDALSLASIYFLAAIGLAITFGVMRVINMAHGEFIMMGAYTGYVVQLFVPDYTISILVALPLAFAVTFGAGVAMERLVIRWLYHRPLETLLATFGISIALQQLAKNIFGTQARPLTAPGWLDGALVFNDIVAISYIRIAIFVMALVFLALLVFVLNRTRLGLEVRAVTQNPGMAASMGIDPDRINMLTFGLGSGIAGVAGVAIGLFAQVTSELGQGYIVQSFMTVVVGGVGNIFGALAGATLIGFLQKGIEWFNPSNTLAAQTYMILFIILFIQFRPKGIIALKGRAAGD